MPVKWQEASRLQDVSCLQASHDADILQASAFHERLHDAVATAMRVSMRTRNLVSRPDSVAPQGCIVSCVFKLPKGGAQAAGSWSGCFLGALGLLPGKTRSFNPSSCRLHCSRGAGSAAYAKLQRPSAGVRVKLHRAHHCHNPQLHRQQQLSKPLREAAAGACGELS